MTSSRAGYRPLAARNHPDVQGWSIPEVGRLDPDYLGWLARTPNGRRHRTPIHPGR